MNVKEYLITGKESVVAVMQQMDSTGCKVLFVAKDGVLKGAVSEGDIRRHILAGGDLKDCVDKIACYSPLSLKEDDKKAALALMREKNISGIPVVDEEGRVLKVYLWNEEVSSTASGNLKAPVVMMAGGKGTRLYPYTKILPKPLIPVGEKPIAEIIMDRFAEYGCEKFFLIVNHKKNMIKAYFNEAGKPYSIKYADEDTPLGTGGGLALLKGKIKDTFILTNCDILIDEDFEKIFKHHKDSGNMITMICSLRNFQIAYGVVDIGEQGEITAMREKPEYSFFTNTGSYIVEPEVIDYIKENENIGFPDIIKRIQEAGGKAGVYPINENAWMDMGQLDELSKMEGRLSE